MKTKKQVLDEFARLQKKYADIRGFAIMEVYNGQAHWCVSLRLSHFKGRDLDWVEKVEWNNFSYQHNNADEARNESAMAEFIKKMDERMKANGAA